MFVWVIIFKHTQYYIFYTFHNILLLVLLYLVLFNDFTINIKYNNMYFNKHNFYFCLNLFNLRLFNCYEEQQIVPSIILT